VILSKFCGNCTKAISWPFLSSMKKHAASRTVSESFAYMSQSRLRIKGALLISDDTLICTFEKCLENTRKIYVYIYAQTEQPHFLFYIEEKLKIHVRKLKAYIYIYIYQCILSSSFEVVRPLGSLFSCHVYQCWQSPSINIHHSFVPSINDNLRNKKQK
jgi:hypothetical protein